jgi:hypothetical protein
MKGVRRMDIDVELVKALFEALGDIVAIDEDKIFVTNDSADAVNSGGITYPNTTQGREDAIDLATYCLLNPLED